MRKKIEIAIPSVLGSEKNAIEQAAVIAQKIGFTQERVADLKTAIAEACINAIEHGNKFNKDISVDVTLTFDEKELCVSVLDAGEGIKPENIPKERTAQKITSNNKRGWGIFIIKNLVNEFSFGQRPEGGGEVRMIIHHDQRK